MKAKIIGSLLKEGVSTKSGSPKPYAIAEIYVIVPFSDRDTGAKGFMGGKHNVSVDVLRRVNHLEFPFDAEFETRDVMVYGKQALEIVDIKPIARPSTVQKVV